MTEATIISKADPTVLTTEALERAIAGLKELLVQRVESESKMRVKDIEAVQRELALLDKQRNETKKSDADALAAALSAAKEAVQQNTNNFEKSITKTETATNDLIKSLGDTFNTAIAGVDKTISDAKDRINKLEQGQAAAGGQAKGTDAMMPWVFGIVASVVAVVSIIIQLSH